MYLPGPETSSEFSVFTESCSKRMEGNKELVLGYSVEYADILHVIHFYSAVSN